MKDQVSELMGKLKNHKDIIITYKYQNKKNDFDYYNYLSGTHKGGYFKIFLYKLKGCDPAFKIEKGLTDNLEEFQEFLKTLTNLKFTLSRK